MRLEALRIRNLGPFRDFALDLADYEGQTLLAVTGPNGAGKSTLLELAIPGAMYRNTPTRGSLVELATARDAMLEARVVNGSTWTLRHLVDKVSGKSEAVILDAEGAPALDSSKVREFDGWVASHLPSPEVLFSSVFGAQGSEGFIAMKPSERKAVLLRALGLERLEQLAGDARERARDAKVAVDVARARLAEVEAGSDDRSARDDVAEAERAAFEAEAEAKAAERLLEGARLEAADHTLARRRFEEETARRSTLRSRLTEVETSLADVSQRLANNRAILADSERILAAVAEAEALKREMEDTEERLRAQRHELALWERDHAEAKRAGSDHSARMRRVHGQLQDLAAVADLARLLPERRQRVAEASEEVARAEVAAREVSEAALLGADGRIAGLRAGLESVAQHDDALLARLALDRDDDAARIAEEHPAKVAAAEGLLSTAKKTLAEASRELAEVEAAAARLPQIDALKVELEEAMNATAQAQDAVAGLEARRPGADIDALASSLEGLRARATALEPLAKRAVPLASAEARVGELAPRAEELTTERDTLAREVERLPELTPPGAEPAIDALETEARRLAAVAREAVSRVGVARARVEAAEAAAVRAKELRTELATLEAEHADWVRLAADLGRDGLQAAEIDAAGPELTSLVNDLLHTCVGPRWTVSIETTRLSADGKRQLEGCDVRVIDTERGRDAEAGTFSGGERVLLGEAVSLALSMLACRRAGLEGVTLVRDESGAALDPANARAYVAMLRRAAKLVGARHVLFVSHSPEVVDLADARIEIPSVA